MTPVRTAMAVTYVAAAVVIYFDVFHHFLLELLK